MWIRIMNNIRELTGLNFNEIGREDVKSFLMYATYCKMDIEAKNRETQKMLAKYKARR